MEMISLNDLHFAYNGHPVINGISHDFLKGSFTAVMGPNGSGKTTLIRLLCRLIEPRSGTIHMQQQLLSKVPQEMWAQKMAYVPQQQTNVFPATVFDTVMLGRKPYIRWSPSGYDRRVVSEVLVQLGLEDMAFKDINRLSSGQRQRVYMARALAQEPEIILLDEPTANLDLQHQHEVMTILQQLADKGITVIIAIHDLNLALSYCSDFLLLHHGKPLAGGDRSVVTKERVEYIYKVSVTQVEAGGEQYFIPLKSRSKC